MAKPTPVDFNFELGSGEIAHVTADNPAQLNQFWGSVNSQLAQTGIHGEHTSAAGAFTPDPGDGGRAGVGNLSKTDEDFINPQGSHNVNTADGGNGLHAAYNGSLLGHPELLPPGVVEATIDPIFPHAHGNVGFDIIG
jgi:hypothetical protein